MDAATGGPPTETELPPAAAEAELPAGESHTAEPSAADGIALESAELSAPEAPEVPASDIIFEADEPATREPVPAASSAAPHAEPESAYVQAGQPLSGAGLELPDDFFIELEENGHEPPPLTARGRRRPRPARDRHAGGRDDDRRRAARAAAGPNDRRPGSRPPQPPTPRNRRPAAGSSSPVELGEIASPHLDMAVTEGVDFDLSPDHAVPKPSPLPGLPAPAAEEGELERDATNSAEEPPTTSAAADADELIDVVPDPEPHLGGPAAPAHHGVSLADEVSETPVVPVAAAAADRATSTETATGSLRSRALIRSNRRPKISRPRWKPCRSCRRKRPGRSKPHRRRPWPWPVRLKPAPRRPARTRWRHCRRRTRPPTSSRRARSRTGSTTRSGWRSSAPTRPTRRGRRCR